MQFSFRSDFRQQVDHVEHFRCVRNNASDATELTFSLCNTCFVRFKMKAEKNGKNVMRLIKLLRSEVDEQKNDSTDYHLSMADYRGLPFVVRPMDKLSS
jgi:hypothetical protein